MQMQWCDHVRDAATRRARRAKRRSGRVLVCAFGFGVAYYLDAANGPERRRRLRHQLRAAARRVDGLLASDTPQDGPSVSSPRLPILSKRPTILGQPQSETG